MDATTPRDCRKDMEWVLNSRAAVLRALPHDHVDFDRRA